MEKKRLRHGFTTGSAATAAVKAALLSLLVNMDKPCKTDIPLPEKGRLTVPVESVETFDGYARAVVIKDGGDDPDATHRARISCTVRFMPGAEDDCVAIRGGPGVGRVTKPGLPVPPGEPAINPGPRMQLKKVVKECFSIAGVKQKGVLIYIEVEDGEKIAKKTLNPRLGIVGGISILGTRGTVIPFSHEAYEETITLSMDIALAGGTKTIVLSTGGKSERLAKELHPGLADISFIQVADFFSFSLKEAAKRGFGHIIYSCFFGKLLKMAQGCPYTHAKKSSIDFAMLVKWRRSVCMAENMEDGITEADARKLENSNTARQALGLIKTFPCAHEIVTAIAVRALSQARKFAGPLPDIDYCVFTMEGRLLARIKEKGTRRRA